MMPDLHVMVEMLKDHPLYLFILVAIAFMLIICSYLDVHVNLVTMGLADSMQRDLRHGTVWMTDEDGVMVRKDFRVDRPEYLENPHRLQIKNMFHQLRKLGYEPDHLEILVGDKVRVYRVDHHRPICSAPRWA
jgi:hypothetical protein